MKDLNIGISTLHKLKTYDAKPKELKVLILEALHLIESFGVPLNNLSPRHLECMAMAFLAVVDVKSSSEWKNARDLNSGYSLKTRDIITYWNKHFSENVSSGSYDDVRRKYLLLLVMAEIIIINKPESARNDPSRGYALNPQYTKMIQTYNTSAWKDDLKLFMNNVKSLDDKMKQTRDLKKVEITIPSGKTLEFSPGEHNELQKAIVEKFLPYFGNGAELLYLGDTANKHLINEQERLKELGFFKLEHGELPDIIAYSPSKNWLFVIEAVYSCNPITVTRKIKIEELTKKCSADIIYVSAFLDRKTFSSFDPSIAWETEVWIAESPQHMIHFNGDKFLGAYSK